MTILLAPHSVYSYDRSRDMSASKKEKFKQAAKGVAVSVILETRPPYFHLQF